MFLLPFSYLFGVDFVGLFSSLVFLDYISPINICCKAVLVVLSSFNFCLSEKLFTSPSILKEIHAGYSNLGCIFFPFSTSFLACTVSAARSAVKRMGFPLYFTCCFSLAAFNVLSCLVFVGLISMCLGMFLFEFILYGTLFASWTWLTISFSLLGKFPTIISSKVFSYPFFFSSSQTPIIQMLVPLILFQMSLDYPQFFSFLLLYCALQKLFLPFYLPAHLFILLQILIPSRVFLISVIVLFVSVC